MSAPVTYALPVSILSLLRRNQQRSFSNNLIHFYSVDTFSDGEYENTRCLPCPYRLGSTTNSAECNFCAKGFYLIKADVDKDTLKRIPNTYCKKCPNNAVCDSDTTINNMKGKKNYWRDSNQTSTFYRCNIKAEVCMGESCSKGHDGVMCKVCTNKNEYFNAFKGKCMACPPFARWGVLFGVIFAILLLLWMLKHAAYHQPKIKSVFSKVVVLIASTRLQAKLKVFISFFQIVVTIETLYGAKVHSNFTSWFNVLNFFNFDLNATFGVPESCMGSMQTRLLLNAFWPFVLLLLCSGYIFLQQICVSGGKRNKKLVFAKVWSRSLHVGVVIIYLVLPSVCRKIFEAKNVHPLLQTTKTRH